MLYKLSSRIDRIEPLPFLDFEQADALEKQLEDLIANHLLEVLYEGAPLLPIFQERRRQEEADIYALDRNGDLVVFELKRAGAGRGALEQLLCYVEKAGSWNYFVLNQKFAEYLSKRKGKVSELREIHCETFGLKEPLEDDQFNKKQKMYVVANSAEDSTSSFFLIEFTQSVKTNILNSSQSHSTFILIQRTGKEFSSTQMHPTTSLGKPLGSSG